MEVDYYHHVQTCHKCQIYANKIHVPPVPLNVLISYWPFTLWGIDVIGHIESTASNEHRFILVAIDYFSKWVEAVTYANVTRCVVARFLKKEIISHYGVPNKIIINNESNFNNRMMKDLCKNFKIKHHNSLWWSQGSRQTHQENHAKDGRNLQRLAWDAPVYIGRSSYFYTHIH